MRKVGCLTPLDTECYISTYTDPMNKNLSHFLSQREKIKFDPDLSNTLSSGDTNSPTQTVTSPTKLKSYTTKSLGIKVKTADTLKVMDQGKASILQLFEKNVLHYTTPLMPGTSGLPASSDNENVDTINMYRKILIKDATNCLPCEELLNDLILFQKTTPIQISTNEKLLHLFFNTLKSIRLHVNQLRINDEKMKITIHHVIEISYGMLVLEILAFHPGNTVFLCSKKCLWETLIQLLEICDCLFLQQITVHFLVYLCSVHPFFVFRLKSEACIQRLLQTLLQKAYDYSMNGITWTTAHHLFLPRLQLIFYLVNTQNNEQILNKGLLQEILSFWDWVVKFDNSVISKCRTIEAARQVFKKRSNMSSKQIVILDYNTYDNIYHWNLPSKEYRVQMDLQNNFKAKANVFDSASEILTKRLQHFIDINLDCDLCSLLLLHIQKKVSDAPSTDTLSILTVHCNTSPICPQECTIHTDIVPLILRILARAQTLRQWGTIDTTTLILRVLPHTYYTKIFSPNMVQDGLDMIKTHYQNLRFLFTDLDFFTLIAGYIRLSYLQVLPWAATILKQSCLILSAMCVDVPNQDFFPHTKGKKKFLQLLVSALKEWNTSSDYSVSYSICAVICNLTYDNIPVKRYFGQIHACEAITQLLDLSISSPTIHSMESLYAFWAIGNLALYIDNLQYFQTSHLPFVLNKYLQKLTPEVPWIVYQTYWKTLSYLMCTPSEIPHYTVCVVAVLESFTKKPVTNDAEIRDAYIWSFDVLARFARHKKTAKFLESRHVLTSAFNVVQGVKISPVLDIKIITLLRNLSSQVPQCLKFYTRELYQLCDGIFHYTVECIQQLQKKQDESSHDNASDTVHAIFPVCFKSLLVLSYEMQQNLSPEMCVDLLSVLIEILQTNTQSPSLSCGIIHFIFKLFAIKQIHISRRLDSIDTKEPLVPQCLVTNIVTLLKISDETIVKLVQSIRSLFLLPQFLKSTQFLKRALSLLLYIASLGFLLPFHCSLLPRKTALSKHVNFDDTSPDASCISIFPSQLNPYRDLVISLTLIKSSSCYNLLDLLTRYVTEAGSTPSTCSTVRHGEKETRNEVLRNSLSLNGYSFNTHFPFNKQTIVEELSAISFIHDNRHIEKQCLLLLHLIIESLANDETTKKSFCSSTQSKLLCVQGQELHDFLIDATKLFQSFKSKLSKNFCNLWRGSRKLHLLAAISTHDTTWQNNLFFNGLALLSADMRTKLLEGGKMSLVHTSLPASFALPPQHYLFWKASPNLKFIIWDNGIHQRNQFWKFFKMTDCVSLHFACQASQTHNTKECCKTVTLTFLDSYRKFDKVCVTVECKTVRECIQFYDAFSLWKATATFSIKP